MKHADQRYAALFKHNPDAVFTMDIDGRLIGANPAAEALTGYSNEELLDLSFVSLLFRGESNQMFHIFRNLGNSEVYSMEKLVIKHKDGSLCEIQLTAFPIAHHNDRADIQAVAKKTTDMRDALTGLPNRQSFQTQLKKTVEQTLGKVGILFINIDRFKPINSTFGHTVGDLFLREAAKRMADCLGGQGILARIGGDEFAFLMPELSNADELMAAAGKLVRSWKQPVLINDLETRVTVSVGASVFPDNGQDFISLMKNADIAMHKAKENGKNQVQMYTPRMDEHAYDKFVLASEFHRALMLNEFILHYQPRLNLLTNTIECVEALIRWNHPKRGLIPPSEFIPIAEETGFILTLGQWVLEEACRQAQEWRSMGIPPVRVAVNVSALQFLQPHFLSRVKNALSNHALDTEWLEIEITESTLMQSEETNIKILQELREIGIQVSIDDFGTGYSSLNYLKKFKVNALKIDKSFVHDLPNDTITKTIIQLAHSLGLTVIAEGVELKQQFDFLKDNGCEQVQGYLIGKPVTPEHCVWFLRHNRK